MSTLILFLYFYILLLKTRLLQKTYEQMFQLLHKSNQNQRVLINQQGAVTDISRAKDEFARYKALVEALERRGVADAEAIARLETGSLRDQRLISQLSSSLDSTKQVQALKQSHAGMQEDIKQLSTALAHEREIRESLCAELASLPSNEQLFQTSSDLAFMRARATELHCAMEVVLQYMQVSAGSVEGPDSTAVTQALEAALVSSLRKELEEENQDKARVVFQRDALEKNNKVLAQQVLALLGQLGRTHLEFPMNLEPPDDNLITKGRLLFSLFIIICSSPEYKFLSIIEVNAGAVQALAGPTAAAQFATIADLERSLLHFKQLSAHQAERLKFLEASSSPVEGVRASVEDPMEEIAHDNAIIELEAELEDAKNLANLYYEKLQAGSDLLKVQRAQQEQTVADLDAAQNEILLLQQQLAEALMKTISDVEDEDNIDNVNKQRDKSEKVDDSEEVQELNSIIDDLETQLEEAKNLANLYYEKLQAGADYIKQQKAAQEAVEAQLAETQTELVSLREQIAGADQSKMEALSVSVAGEVASRRQLKVLQKEMESTQATIVELESQLSVLRETATLAATTAASPSLADDVPPPHEDSTALLQEKEEALSQLTADLEEAETQLEEMSTTLETYYARLQAGADYTKVLRADLEAVTAERDSFLSMKDSSLVVDGNEDSKLSQVTFELTKATDQIEQLLNGASVYESRMQQNDKKIGELNSEIANLKAERADLLSRLEMLQTEDSPISTTESKEVEKLKLEIITLQGKLQDTTPRESSRDLQRKFDLLERGYVEECAKKDETIEQLMTDLDSAEGRLEELSETMNQYYERLKDGAEHSKKASEETKLISIERDALIAKVIKLEEDITLMKATPIQTPTSSVDKEDHSKFTTKITELESERNIAKQNFKSLQENNANLQKQVTQLEAEIDSLKASIDPFAVSVSTNEDKLSKLSAQIVSAENERDSFKVSVQKLQSDKVALESQIAQLIAELDAIRRDSPSSDNRLKRKFFGI